jgi:hypothetical protein
VPADLSFVMTLIVAGGGQRRPSTPYTRDHLSSPPAPAQRFSRRHRNVPGGMGGIGNPADAAICQGPSDWAAQPAMALSSGVPAACLAIGLSCEPATHVSRRLGGYGYRRAGEEGLLCPWLRVTTHC